MRWENRRKSGNIEDRRGRKVSKGIKGGGIGILLLALVGMYFGVDPSVILNLGEQLGTTKQRPPVITSPQLKKTGWLNLYPLSLPTPRIHGRSSSTKKVPLILNRSWFSFPDQFNLPVVLPNPQWALFTAREIKKSTLTSAFTKT